MKNDNYDLEKLREMVKSCRWGWATSMKTVPHEYVVRGKCALTDEQFVYFVNAQRELGVHERWGKYNFPYLYLDGYKYWTMGAPISETIILNRQKVFNEFDNLVYPIPKHYSPSEMKLLTAAISNMFRGKQIFEACCGEGTFVDYSHISKNEYRGVDASKKAIERFKNFWPAYKQRVSNKSFEESIEKWQSDKVDVVIVLFGMASYIMRQYISEMLKARKDYLLMFFRDGFLPEQLKDTHPFYYTREDLEYMFPFAYFYAHKNYYTVCSKSIDWEKAKTLLNNNDLFSV